MPDSEEPAGCPWVALHPAVPFLQPLRVPSMAGRPPSQPQLVATWGWWLEAGSAWARGRE